MLHTKMHINKHVIYSGENVYVAVKWKVVEKKEEITLI